MIEKNGDSSQSEMEYFQKTLKRYELKDTRKA